MPEAARSVLVLGGMGGEFVHRLDRAGRENGPRRACDDSLARLSELEAPKSWQFAAARSARVDPAGRARQIIKQNFAFIIMILDAI